MNDLTQILTAAAEGDQRAAEELLPLVYAELRKLAESRMAKVPAGNTLQPTALVHEAFVRLVGTGDPGWKGRHHFFGAAAQAMRDILVEQARRKSRSKRGGDRKRIDLEPDEMIDGPRAEDVLAIHEALTQLEAKDARSAEIVSLRYFGGMTEAEISAALGVSDRTVRREWRFAKSWLQRALTEPQRDGNPGASDDAQP